MDVVWLASLGYVYLHKLNERSQLGVFRQIVDQMPLTNEESDLGR